MQGSQVCFLGQGTKNLHASGLGQKKKVLKKEIPDRHHRLLLPAPGSALGHVQLTESSALSSVAGIRKEWGLSLTESVPQTLRSPRGAKNQGPLTATPHSPSGALIRVKEIRQYPERKKRAQRGVASCPRSHSCSVAELGSGIKSVAAHSCGAPGGSRRVPGWEVWGVMGRVGG